MRWIKATERLPEHYKMVPIKAYGKIGFGQYQENRSPKMFWYQTVDGNGTLTEDIFSRLEWLDESDEWISVDTALPEKRIRVNICIDDELVKIGYVDTDGIWKAEEYDFESDYSGLSNVTRWQPLPQPPKQ